MDSMFDNIKKLYDFELYSNVTQLACIMEGAYNADRSTLTPEQYFLLQMFNANSLFYERQYQSAESFYRSALIARKPFDKKKSPLTFSNEHSKYMEIFKDHEIRFKIAQCLEISKNTQEAITMLESIPDRNRPPKADMLLGKLCRKIGHLATAEHLYDMALRANPFNFDAIKTLFADLDVTDTDVESVFKSFNLPSQCDDILLTLVHVYRLIHTSNYTQAIIELENFQKSSIFAKNELFDVLIGQCYLYNDDIDLALRYLTKAQGKNCYLLNGLTSLANIYTSRDDVQSLEKLIAHISPSEYLSEHWHIVACQHYVLRKYDKATYFATKACYMNSANVDAAILNAQIFIKSKKFNEAISLLRNLLNHAPNRLEIYDKLVCAYRATNRLREAQLIATEAVRIIGKTPRTYVLVAKPLFLDPRTRQKAKPFLKKALELNKNFVPAGLMLTELLKEEGDFAGAKQLIKNLITLQPTSFLYSKLASICTDEKETGLALQYYMQAINLDPNNREAVNKLVALGDVSNDNKEADQSTTSSNMNDTRNEQDINTEMIDTQQLSPPSEMLSGIDDDDDSSIW